MSNYPAEALARAAAVERWEVLYDDVRRRRAAGQSLRQINRLKLLKRSMYGRAKLDLLRRRFLLAA